jgi:hypothetical protein
MREACGTDVVVACAFCVVSAQQRSRHRSHTGRAPQELVPSELAHDMLFFRIGFRKGRQCLASKDQRS